MESDVRPIEHTGQCTILRRQLLSLPETGGGAEFRRGDEGGVARRPLSAGLDVSVVEMHESHQNIRTYALNSLLLHCLSHV